VIKRLLYDPAQSCPLGHTAVQPFTPYETDWGPVRRFRCLTCHNTYSELVKPKQNLEAAILVAHYYGHVSNRRFPIVSGFIANAMNGRQGLRLPRLNVQLSNGEYLYSKRTITTDVLCSLPTVKRTIRKYAFMAENAPPDAITRLLRPRFSGFFGLDGKLVPIGGEKRAYLFARDLVWGDVPSALLATSEDPFESLANCRMFLRRFRATIEGIGIDIRQVLLDERKEFWEACGLELPKKAVLTSDGDHFLRDIENKKLPETFRSPKTAGLIAELEYAIRRSHSRDEANKVFQHIREARDHWLDGEMKRAQVGIDQILQKLTTAEVHRLFSHFDLVRPGNRLHFRTTNATEASVGVYADTIDSISCFQSEEQAPGQLNLITLIYRLMPTSMDGRSVLQKCRVNRTLADLMPILHAFDSNSPIQ